MLKQIIHRPIPGFTKTARLVKADTRGGTIDFDVNYLVNGATCTETYRLQWKFDQDMSILAYRDQSVDYGFEVRTQVLNGNCGKIQPWRNPFVVAVANDVSSSSIIDEQGYDEVSIADGIIGGSGARIFFRNDDWVRFNQARQGFLRGRFSTRNDRNSYGKYSWFKFTIVGNSNAQDPKASFQYEIVYTYDIVNPPQYVNYNTLTLERPSINRGIGGPEGRRGINIRVAGELAASSGKEFHLEAHFEDAQGRSLKANPSIPPLSDKGGNAVVKSAPYLVPPNDYRLEQISLWMPFVGLNRSQLQRNQAVYVYVELWIDGEATARSPKVLVNWP